MNNKTYINADTGTTRSKEQIKLGLFLVDPHLFRGYSFMIHCLKVGLSL